MLLLKLFNFLAKTVDSQIFAGPLLHKCGQVQGDDRVALCRFFRYQNMSHGLSIVPYIQYTVHCPKSNPNFRDIT